MRRGAAMEWRIHPLQLHVVRQVRRPDGACQLRREQAKRLQAGLSQVERDFVGEG